VDAVSNWKLYEPLTDVAVYHNENPGDRSITVMAKLIGAGTTTPLRVWIDGVCTLELTVEQSASLRAKLELAEADLTLVAGMHPTTATDDEGRCESCSRPVRAGERVIVEDEGTEDRVVLHAECPAQGRN
jgi:hypothetical protein